MNERLVLLINDIVDLLKQSVNVENFIADSMRNEMLRLPCAMEMLSVSEITDLCVRLANVHQVAFQYQQKSTTVSDPHIIMLAETLEKKGHRPR